MKLIPELEDVLGWSKDQMRKELGVSRATLHRWEAKGLPPMMTLGNEQRLSQVVLVALDHLKKTGEEERAGAIVRRFQLATRQNEALNGWSLKSLPTYTHETVLPLRPVIQQASQLWAQKCQEYFDAHGDRGTCVIGAGFYLSYQPDGAQKPRAWNFLHAYSVTPCQSSNVWEASKDEVHKFLLDNGVVCEYDYGNVD